MGFTTLGSHFIIAHFEMTLDTSEKNILYEDMTSFWFRFLTAAEKTHSTWGLVVQTTYPTLLSDIMIPNIHHSIFHSDYSL